MSSAVGEAAVGEAAVGEAVGEARGGKAVGEARDGVGTEAGGLESFKKDTFRLTAESSIAF